MAVNGDSVVFGIFFVIKNGDGLTIILTERPNALSALGTGWRWF